MAIVWNVRPRTKERRAGRGEDVPRGAGEGCFSLAPARGAWPTGARSARPPTRWLRALKIESRIFLGREAVHLSF